MGQGIRPNWGSTLKTKSCQLTKSRIFLIFAKIGHSKKSLGYSLKPRGIIFLTLFFLYISKPLSKQN